MSTACGQPALDVRAYWNAANARSIVDACGDNGRTAYLQLQLADLVYPAALAGLLLVSSALLLRRFESRTWPVLLPIVVMTVLDYMENAGIWVLLLQWPDVTAPVANAAGIITAVKRVFGFIAFSTPLALGAIAIVHRIRRGRVRDQDDAGVKD